MEYYHLERINKILQLYRINLLFSRLLANIQSPKGCRKRKNIPFSRRIWAAVCIPKAVSLRMDSCWTNLVKTVLFWTGHFSLDLVFWNGSAEDAMRVKASVKEAEGAQALGKVASSSWCGCHCTPRRGESIAHICVIVSSYKADLKQTLISIYWKISLAKASYSSKKLCRVFQF